MSTFVERLLGGKAGTVVTVEPDWIVINDGVSHAAVEEISAVAKPEKVMVIYDHDVPTGRPEAAAILRKNLAFAEKYGCPYIQAEGVGYQYMLNEVVKPGQIIVGGGSHGSIFGSIGALGINVSIPELARAAETDRYSIIVPETVYVNLEGSLKEGVTVMDAALAFLAEDHELNRKAVEVYAPSFDAHEKAVFCSMACITGAFTASITEEKQSAGLTLNLATVEPMVMLPCSDRNDQKKAARNKAIRSKVKTAIKKVEAAVAAGDKAAAQAALVAATTEIDKACTKGVYHKNNAARKVSRVSKAVNSIA